MPKRPARPRPPNITPPAEEATPVILDLPELKRPADTDVSDLTTAKRTGPAFWEGPGRLVLPFDRDLTAAETEAVVLRLTTIDPVQEQLHGAAKGALVTNRTYLALAASTPAQDKAQVKALTRQTQALIRLVLGLHDGTD